MENTTTKTTLKDIMYIHNKIKMKKFMFFAYMILTDDNYTKTPEGIKIKTEIKTLNAELKNMMKDLEHDDFVDAKEIMKINSDIFDNKMFTNRLCIYHITESTNNINIRLKVFKQFIDRFGLDCVAV
jgi:hypothetical protein